MSGSKVVKSMSLKASTTGSVVLPGWLATCSQLAEESKVRITKALAKMEESLVTLSATVAEAKGVKAEAGSRTQNQIIQDNRAAETRT